ncbi:DUF397 domain-containing protein [Streptomyces sp. NPDC005963]|uniref:DUF397 domain-containing protein n=1 Tax=Streptomyces sp. NPDC005963 TaxID=3156721 RepID=UPI0033D44DBC
MISLTGWIKSSYSGNDGGQCIEVAPAYAPSGVVPVRDSKRPSGPVLMVSTDAFAGLVALARSSDV